MKEKARTTAGPRHTSSRIRPRTAVGSRHAAAIPQAQAASDLYSSLSPSLEWDGKNSVRELGEWLLACIEDAAKLPPAHGFAEPGVFRDEAEHRVAECRGCGTR